jgi:cytochrome c biogenesis protein CcmG/thiol:disulfide interchange protein DsbE
MLNTPKSMQSPADWRGKFVFVNFFASWCAPCRAEHPFLQKLKAESGLMMVGIAHADRPTETQRMLDTLGNPFDIVLDDMLSKGGKSWGVNGVPESFILDAQGTVIWNHRGPLGSAIINNEIVPLLKQRQDR